MPQSLPVFRTALIGMASLALAVGIGRFVFTPLLPMMQADGLLDVVSGGWLASIHFLGYWLGALVAAKIPCPPRTMLRLSLLVIGLSTLAMGLTPSYPVWLGLRWICGVCSAWVLVMVSSYYIRYLAEAGFARYQGWIFTGVGGGIALTGLGCLAFMVTATDSLSSWLVTGAVSLVAIAFVIMSMGKEIPTSRSSKHIVEARHSPLDWRAITAYGAFGLGYIIPATYLPYMAREIVGDPLVFGWVWPVFGAAAALSTLLSALLYRRFSNRGIWVACQLVMAAGLLLPVMQTNIMTLTISGLSVGGTFMIITMAGMKDSHDVAVPEDVVRHIAAMTTAFATGQMIGPVFASTLHGVTGNFAVPFAFTSALLAATALLLIAGGSVVPQPK